MHAWVCMGGVKVPPTLPTAAGGQIACGVYNVRPSLTQLGQEQQDHDNCGREGDDATRQRLGEEVFIHLRLRATAAVLHAQLVSGRMVR